MATPEQKFLDAVSRIPELQNLHLCVKKIPMSVITTMIFTFVGGWFYGPIVYIVGNICSVFIAIRNGNFTTSMHSFILHNLTSKQEDQLIQSILNATGFENVDQFNLVHLDHNPSPSLAAIITSNVVSHVKRQPPELKVGSPIYLKVEIIN